MNPSEICTLIYIRQVLSPAKMTFVGVGILLLVSILFISQRNKCNAYYLQAAKDVRGQNTLVGVFERIEIFFQRLEIYTEVLPTTEMMEMAIRIVVEVFLILGIATKEIKQGRISE